MALEVIPAVYIFTCDFCPAKEETAGQGPPSLWAVLSGKTRVTPFSPDDSGIRKWEKYVCPDCQARFSSGGNASAAMTAAWREALDAGLFASFPGCLYAAA